MTAGERTVIYLMAALLGFLLGWAIATILGWSL